MPYVDFAGLSRFAGKSKDFASSACAGPDMANWQKTPAAGAVSFSPVPEMPLDPVVNFLFTETGPAEGTKSPDNPSTITGVTQAKVTRCGKNLLPRDPVSSVMSQRGITVTYNEDGSIHLKGTATEGYDAYMSYFNNATLGVVPSVMAAGRTITVSVACNDSNVSGKIYDSNSLTVWGNPVNVSPGTPVTHTMQSSVKSAMFRIMVTRGSTVDCDVHCQIEYGDTATFWEAPADTTYTLPLGGTYYGGSVDLSTGVMTVTQFQIAFTGDESFSSSDKGDGWLMFVHKPSNVVPLDGSVDVDKACTHFPFVYSASQQSLHWYVQSAGNICIFSNEFADVDVFKSWLAAQALAGTPVRVTYKIATPYTVQLTPTQIYSLSQIDPYNPRINTVYSDQISVQTGYPKSPQTTQNELTNAVVSLGGNV